LAIVKEPKFVKNFESMSNSTPTLKNDVSRVSSLQTYLGVVVFVSIAIPAVISGTILIYQNFQRSIEHDSLATANRYADQLQAGMSIPLWNIAPDLGKPLVESIFVDQSVLSVIIYTDSGEEFLKYIQDEFESHPDTRTVTRPIMYEGERMGEVNLVYSVKRAIQQASRDARLLLSIILIQLIVTLISISFVLSLRVISPLKRLGKAAHGIALGDLRTAIPRLRRDEFGSLAFRLEDMRRVLEENFTELENRVSNRTAELQAVNAAMKGTLDQLEAAQDNLIQSEKLAALGSLVAGVAHELNTPIGNGLTVATALVDSCKGVKNQMNEGLTKSALDNFITDMDEGTHLVFRNLQKSSELVSSFKQVAVDRTSAQRRKFSMIEILQETVLTVSPAFKRTNYIVDIDVQEDVILDSYPGPLGQVVTNLLNNALIHAFEGKDQGTVLLKSAPLSDRVELQVKDNGVGIPKTHLDKIFNPFFTTKLGNGGNGLGMHIVHNIVTGILGGTIEVESEIGVGTCFTLQIPLFAPKHKVGSEDSLDDDTNIVANGQ